MESIGNNGHDDEHPATLGDVLYADRADVVSEQDWVAIVERIAARDQVALEALYERTHRIVFTLMLRITRSRETAEELTLDVFHDIWRRAPDYDAGDGTVLGWIMNQARSRAIDRLRYEQRQKRAAPAVGVAVSPMSDGLDIAGEVADRERILQTALETLTPTEREAIAFAFFAGLTYAEVADRLTKPVGTIKTRIRSGLGKLKRALAHRAEDI